MDVITASAVSIAVLAAILTYILGLSFAAGLPIFAALVAWASFLHCGGKEAGLAKTITHNVFGAIMGYIALLLYAEVASLTSLWWLAICVLITVFILVYCSKWSTLSDVAASLLGFATIFAWYCFGKADAVALTAGSLLNPFIGAVIAMVVGAIVAYIAEKLADAMKKA